MNDDNSNDKVITLGLSKTTTINLWAIIGLFVVNCVLYVCYNFKMKYKATKQKEASSYD